MRGRKSYHLLLMEDIEVEVAAEDFANFRVGPQDHYRSDIDEYEATGAAAAAIPSSVRRWLATFYGALKDCDMREISACFEDRFTDIANSLYRSQRWPSSEVVGPYLDQHPAAIALYHELCYRHIYLRLTPTMDERIESWNNYCQLFELVLDDEAPFPWDLPSDWAWNIIDEFIWQFSRWSHHFNTEHSSGKTTSSSNSISSPKIDTTNAASGPWAAVSVLHYLERLASKVGEGNLSRSSLKYKLGYFARIGLCRVHVLLGDYHLALTALGSMELFERGLYTKVAGCYITLYYCVGFSYLMMRRYLDASRTFTAILSYISKTKQFNTRSQFYDHILKKNEQLLGLLAICLAFCPVRLDDSIMASLRERYGDRTQRMLKGDVAAFEEVFVTCCPKFVSLPHMVVAGNDLMQVQLKLFKEDIRQQRLIPSARSFLKLYSTIDTPKLAAFLETGSVDALSHMLICYKHKTFARCWTGGACSQGELRSASDVDFYICENMVHVQDTRPSLRYGEFFIRHIGRFEEIMAELNRS